MRPLILVTITVLALIVPAARSQSSWTFGTTGIANVSGATAIAYGNGRFVAVLTNALRTPSMAWSPDGVAWTLAPLAPPADDLLFLAGAFYASSAGDLQRSGDGVTWERVQSFGRRITRLVSDGRGLLIGVREGPSLSLIHSPDRATFRDTAPLPIIPPAGFGGTAVVSLSEMAWVSGRYFVTYTAIFPGGSSGSVSRDFCASTTDGSTWTPVAALESAVYLANGGGRLVAGGSFRMLWTSLATVDGVTFTPSSESPRFFNGGRMRYAGGRFCFLGGFVASTDGLTWAPLASAPAASESRSWYAFAYGNGRYVAAGLEFTGPASSRELFATLAAAGAPVIAAPPLDRAVAEGSPTTFTVAIEGAVAGVTYQWRRDGVALAGATTPSFALGAVGPADAGRYTVDVRNSIGTTVSDVAFLTVGPRLAAPVIVRHPASAQVFAGQTATFAVTVSGGAPFDYQWYRNGVAVAGATTDTLTLGSPVLADAGDYTVNVRNATGAATSSAGTLRVTAVPRIINLSVLTHLAGGSDDFTLGYVIGGSGVTGTKPLVLRAVGPSLGALGVTAVAADPKFETYAGGTRTGGNDNWAGGAALVSAFTGVGAFPLSGPGSLDAALVTSLDRGNHSLVVSATDRGAGAVLAEVYDATPDAVFTVSMPRLLNVSVLKPIGGGLTVGFTLAGGMAKFVLIRAVGPTLASFGVVDPAADPRLAVFSAAGQKLEENDDWAGAGRIVSTSAVVGAFALPATSRDAAVLTMLPPGGYSVQVSDAAGSTGAVLVEVYEVP